MHMLELQAERRMQHNKLISSEVHGKYSRTIKRNKYNRINNAENTAENTVENTAENTAENTTENTAIKILQ
jgi:hypothetical protein